jgi:phytanoyl-CoA hydroxylase
MSSITDEQWWQYQQDGYLKLGPVLDATDLTALQERIDAIMLGTAEVDYSNMLMQLDSDSGVYGEMPAQTVGFKHATLNYRKIQGLEFDSLFGDYLRRPLFHEICAHVYGAHCAISCSRAMFMNKPAGKGTILPWHQDGGSGWHMDRDPVVTVWTALDAATIANGCVQVVPGSHKLGLLSEGGHTITPKQEELYCPEEKIVYLELEPGESVLLHNWLLHRSDVNKTETPRRAFSVCYMDARTRTTAGEAAGTTVWRSDTLGLAGV